MANMREIRTRIDSVKDTMKITNAMYLISSSKLRKAAETRYLLISRAFRRRYRIFWIVLPIWRGRFLTPLL